MTKINVTIKSETRSGKEIAKKASEKQIKFANDIINSINSSLDEIRAFGFNDYANEVATDLNNLTTMCESGVFDVITYLKKYADKYAVYNAAYAKARRDRNSAAVNALNPLKLNQ